MSYREHLPDTDDYSGAIVAVNAVIAVVVALLILWWATGFGPFYEEVFRINPATTGPNAGVGANWTFGNTIGWLDFGIALTHAADVIMGVFVLFLVFVHWASFRRLAARMRQPGGAGGADEAVATDGGRNDPAAESDGGEPR